jgi:hypothetical protein
MNPTEIEFAIKALVTQPYDPATFAFDLIAIYNAPKVTVSKLKSGQTNAAATPGDVLWKKKLFFRSAAPTDDVAAIADRLIADPLTAKHKPRFILVTNGEQLHIRDLSRDETCNTEFELLDESSDFLLPLAGFERRDAITENPADVKAAKRLAKLYAAILAANPTWSDGNHTHELNLFMTRVLFCFYAEDTGIFDSPQLFTNTFVQHTHESGADVAPLLDRLFAVMNLKDDERPATTSVANARFPYVNGSLFETTLPIPNFNRTARRLFLECGELDWRTINPDIFGSMIQTIVQPGARGDLGMHYTSVPNIMKVLRPLFLDDLNDTYEKAKDSPQKLEALRARLVKIRVFDPACGSGNFLIIAYKELRQLEMRILGRISELATNNPLRLSGISLHNFFGIDTVDFACETAKLSLWIAEYQMNAAFKDLFGTARPPLPLGKITTIHNGNALRLDWCEVCPKDDSAETYICGNPPYIGSAVQTTQQQDDVARACQLVAIESRELDYISGWFAKGASYIASSVASMAFVTTNSLCQGLQVALLWPPLFSLNLEIYFAYESFKWSNNASNNAGVTCTIIGLRNASAAQKQFFGANHIRTVSEISPYLIPFKTLIVNEASSPLSRGLPSMSPGNQPRDGGHFMLSRAERTELLRSHPDSEPFLRDYRGSKEFIQGIDRSCIWVTDATLSEALTIPPIRTRIDAVRRDRLTRGPNIKQSAHYAHRFRHVTHQDALALLIPKVVSERRHYLPVGVFDESTIISEQAFAVYDPPSHLLAILSSQLHVIWTKAVSGKLENRLRYSNALVYNTFPVPDLSDEQKRVLADHSKAILKARAKHPGKTIAWLYNPETMPANLLEAHGENDAYLEEYVYGRKFKDDTQRLEHLFAMYATMKTKEQTPLLAIKASERKKARV